MGITGTDVRDGDFRVRRVSAGKQMSYAFDCPSPVLSIYRRRRRLDQCLPPLFAEIELSFVRIDLSVTEAHSR